MNERITAIYFAIVDNQVICIDFNIADFRTEFIKTTKVLDRNYAFYRRLFEKEQPYSLEIEGKTYWFQSIIRTPHAKHKATAKTRIKKTLPEQP